MNRGLAADLEKVKSPDNFRSIFSVTQNIGLILSLLHRMKESFDYSRIFNDVQVIQFYAGLHPETKPGPPNVFLLVKVKLYLLVWNIR